MCACPVTACAGGTNAVGDAFHYIRDGYAEVMLCGGTEASITPMSIGGFTSTIQTSINTSAFLREIEVNIGARSAFSNFTSYP